MRKGLDIQAICLCFGMAFEMVAKADGPEAKRIPKLGKILLMLDRDGDENYQPMLIPLSGGIPDPAFGSAFDGYRVRCLESDPQCNLAYLSAESRGERMYVSFQANLATGDLVKLGED